MPWDNKGSGGPWGGGHGGNGGNRGGGPRPPDVEDIIRMGQERMKNALPGGLGPKGLIGIGVLVLLVWLASGVYRVEPNQQGVVMRFGEMVNITNPGLHWHLPYPVETVLRPEVTTIHQINIGFRGSGAGNRSQRRDVAEESLMLTGDQNIIDIDLTVQWKISDPFQYLFNIRDPEATVKIAAESALREIIGRTNIQPALTEARGAIEMDVRESLQGLLDGYEAGVQITEVRLQDVAPPDAVVDAFDDVQRALQDRDRLRNEAERYRNDILPRARGNAQKMIQEANAYKERLLNEATGEADRFLSIYREYKQNPDITQRRIYLETLQKVYENTDKVLMDQGQGTGAVPYLSLNELRNQNRTGAN